MQIHNRGNDPQGSLQSNCQLGKCPMICFPMLQSFQTLHRPDYPRPVFRTTIRSTKWAILNLGVGMMMQDYCGFAMDLANGAGKLHTARVGPSSFGMYDIQSHMMPLHLHALSLACILPYFLTETILQLKSKCKRFILPYGSIHLCRHDIS